jgi:glucose-1-phosphate thymidylyltransferase
VKITNSEITEPCFIGENVVLTNAKIGPNVSIGNGTKIENSTIKNSLIQNESVIMNANLDNAMIGSYAKFDGNFTQISIGDYSVLE